MNMVNDKPVSLPEPTSQSSSLWVWVSLLIALGLSVGSLWLSYGLNLMACPLCYYQRSMALASALVLGVGLLLRVRPSATLAALVVPLASVGLGIAGWHVYLEASGRLTCPSGLVGIGSAPQQSLAGFVLLLGTLLPGCKPRWYTVSFALLIGLACAYACIRTAAPPSPPKDEDKPRTCYKPTATVN